MKNESHDRGASQALIVDAHRTDDIIADQSLDSGEPEPILARVVRVDTEAGGRTKP